MPTSPHFDRNSYANLDDENVYFLYIHIHLKDTNSDARSQQCEQLSLPDLRTAVTISLRIPTTWSEQIGKKNDDFKCIVVHSARGMPDNAGLRCRLDGDVVTSLVASFE